MKVSLVGPAYVRCPLLLELTLPGLSRQRVILPLDGSSASRDKTGVDRVEGGVP